MCYIILSYLIWQSSPLIYQVKDLSKLILWRLVLYMTRPSSGASHTASHVKRLHAWNALLQDGLSHLKCPNQ